MGWVAEENARGLGVPFPKAKPKKKTQ